MAWNEQLSVFPTRLSFAYGPNDKQTLLLSFHILDHQWSCAQAYYRQPTERNNSAWTIQWPCSPGNCIDPQKWHSLEDQNKQQSDAVCPGYRSDRGRGIQISARSSRSSEPTWCKSKWLYGNPCVGGIRTDSWQLPVGRAAHKRLSSSCWKKSSNLQSWPKLVGKMRLTIHLRPSALPQS